MQTCLICDDHAMMREALAGAVAIGWPEAEVWQAVDFPTAWFAAAAGAPDLIISDLVMPGASPVEGIGKLRAAAPNSPVLVVTGNEEDAVLLALFRLGIAGFAPKTSKSAIIEAAIRLVLAGGRYLPLRIAELAARQAAEKPASPPALTVRLTERQTDVLRLVATGESNKQIARELDLSPATIKAHTAAAIAALGAVNRIEAVLKARALGLI